MPGPFAEFVDLFRGNGEPISLRGISGGGVGFFCARLINETNRPLVVVAAGAEQVETLLADCAFFLGLASNDPSLLYFPEDSVNPYCGLSPDLEELRQRLKACFLLNRFAQKIRLLVTTAGALGRKLVAPGDLEQASELVIKHLDLDRLRLASRLLAAGYQRVPLVEDPGTFSIRGCIIDVFPPTSPAPARIELMGDEVERLRIFDPATQRTHEELEELYLPPAREVVFTRDNLTRAESRIKELAAEADAPSRALITLLNEIRAERYFMGIEALLPAFYERLASPFEYLEQLPASFLLIDPPALMRALVRQSAEVARDYRRMAARGEIVFPPHEHYLAPEKIRQWLMAKVHLELAAATPAPAAEKPRVEAVSPENIPLPEQLSGPAVDPSTVAPPPVLLPEEDGEPKLLQWPIKPSAYVYFDLAPAPGLREDIVRQQKEDPLQPLIDRVAGLREEHLAPIIACASPSQAQRIRNLLNGRRVGSRVFAPEEGGPLAITREQLTGAGVGVFIGELSQGVIDAETRLGIIADSEIFGPRPPRSERRAVRLGAVPTLKELDAGDIVVHVEHGLGRFKGLTKLVVEGVENDYVQLEYRGGDKLYLPISRLSALRKYRGGVPAKINLDKLGGTTFTRTKAKVKEAIYRMAGELLQLYAKRESQPGFAFFGRDEALAELEATFPYAETADQQRAIDEVLADMSKTRPMDRLICGDVGYGKTEVAVRAAYRAVLDGKQAALLVPTTVLAMQHYHTFAERLAPLAVQVEVLSRFRSVKEQKQVVDRVKAGAVDVVIGTHRLLSRDIAFKDLGLLIIDEEQRFGVTHKERLKKLKTQVDVMTLTATPIPRTLYMGMTGLRDMSIIGTPPEARLPIRTFLMKFDAAAIREAVLREVRRGGQVFFVHNRVQSILKVKKYLEKLIPEVNIGVAHGQMPAAALERSMVEFIERKAQVLLCTSLIESGLDIPTANTMIVNQADQFGLAQLYQLRGRIGRSRERAYCYLLSKGVYKISEEARRRLQAIVENQDLGAGFNIASQDLEIRGAGDLLGASQSGHIAAVGLDLYTELMNAAVKELKEGRKPADEVDPEIKLPLAAIIPEQYVPDVHERIGYYQRLAQARSEQEVCNIVDELGERFGPIADEVSQLREVMSLKVTCRSLRISHLIGTSGKVRLRFCEPAAIEPAQLVAFVQADPENRKLTPEGELIVSATGQANLAEWIKNSLQELAACGTRAA